MRKRAATLLAGALILLAALIAGTQGMGAQHLPNRCPLCGHSYTSISVPYTAHAKRCTGCGKLNF